jgi:hypothetical protein
MRRALALALTALGPLVALAQTSEPAPSAELACLTPALEQRQPVEYPEDRLKRKEGAFFHLDLTFTHPDRAPRAKVVEDPRRVSAGRTENDFLDAAERYASQLRVPCLPPGSEGFRLRQTFHFVPNDGRRVTVSAPREPEGWSDAFRRVMDCLKPQRGSELWPPYPRRALDQGWQGNVIAQVRFDGPDAEPQVEIVAEPPRMSVFGASVRQAFSNLRAPCAEGAPVSGRVLFAFRIQDDRRVLLPDLDMRRLAGVLRTYPAPVFFDTNALGCPFDLRVTYRAPHMSNVIAEVGDAVPLRQPFLEWLSKVEINLPESARNIVLGDTFTLHVPCLVMDVRPRNIPLTAPSPRS